MSKHFFALATKAVSASIWGIRSPATKILVNPHDLVGVRQLTAEESLAVAGGPQVENEPD
jgi:hypothetical protein